ncbi:hypothetical protein [Prevotella sp.]
MNKAYFEFIADSDIVRNAIQKTTAAYPDYSGMRRFLTFGT